MCERSTVSTVLGMMNQFVLQVMLRKEDRKNNLYADAVWSILIVWAAFLNRYPKYSKYLSNIFNISNITPLCGSRSGLLN